MLKLTTKKLSNFFDQYLVRILMSSGMALGLLWLVRSDLMLLAVILAGISKWQMLIGGPRLWLLNIRDNAADLMILVSILALLGFYSNSNVPSTEIIVIGIYLFWQLVIKPMGGVGGRGAQALTVLLLGTAAIFVYVPIITLAGAIIATWLLAVVAADHYLALMVEDPNRRLLIVSWGLLAAEMAWIFGRWNVIFQFWEGRLLLPLISIVMVSIAYFFGVIYHDHSQKNLSKRRLNIYLVLLTLIILCIIIGSDWASRI